MMWYRFERPINPHYTDIAFVVGPNKRWTEFDTNDLMHAFPEALLGLRTIMATTETLYHGQMYGHRNLRKLNALEHPDIEPAFYRVLNDLRYMVGLLGPPELQWWYVHRGVGIYRTR